VTDLGLRYGLLTAYTSFVAVDSQVRGSDERSVTVEQPLPLPQGVSNLAVGGFAALPAAGAPIMTNMMAAAQSKVKSAREVSGNDESLRADSPLSAAKQQEEVRYPAGNDEGVHGEADKSIPTEESVTVSEGLSREAILHVIRNRFHEIVEVCAFARVTGKITLRVVINPEGTVSDVKVTEDRLGSRETVRRITKLVKKWQFTATGDGQKGEVLMTLRFP
jgi:Ca-activated chloride channel homolog